MKTLMLRRIPLCNPTVYYKSKWPSADCKHIQLRHIPWCYILPSREGNVKRNLWMISTHWPFLPWKSILIYKALKNWMVKQNFKHDNIQTRAPLFMTTKNTNLLMLIHWNLVSPLLVIWLLLWNHVIFSNEKGFVTLWDL